MNIADFRRASALLAIGCGIAVWCAGAAGQGLDPTRSRAPAQRDGSILPRRPPAPADTTPAPVPVAAPLTVSSGDRTLDQIAAVVNSEIITRLELDERVAIATTAMSRQGMQMPPKGIVERQVLERMITEKAELQLAVEGGVRVDDLQLDRAVQRVAEQNNLSVQAFRDRLEAEGTPFGAFRDDLRTQIMIERARSHEVDDKIQVGEGEVDAFLATQSGTAPGAQGEVDLAQVLVRVSESASPEQVEKQRARANEVFDKAKGGADFKQLAATYSEGPEALQGGDLGFRSPDRLPQLFLDAIAPLAIGQVTAPVRSPIGFHVLKLVARRNAGANPQIAVATQAPVQQTHARHILIKVSEVVSADQARARLEEVRQRLVNKTADFEDMARAYSNDTSANRGGDLGTLYPGDTVPEFEKAMNALAPGEISEPVKTQFGYHLIQVVERKTQDVAQDRLRLIARQAIRDRKIDEAADAWARELRDRAYVEMRIDDK